MAIKKIDTDQIRSHASQYGQTAATIATTSKGVTNKVHTLVGASFTGKDGQALAQSIATVGAAMAGLTDVLDQVVETLKRAAGTYDETESANAIGLGLK